MAIRLSRESVERRYGLAQGGATKPADRVVASDLTLVAQINAAKASKTPEGQLRYLSLLLQAGERGLIFEPDNE